MDKSQIAHVNQSKPALKNDVFFVGVLLALNLFFCY